MQFNRSILRRAAAVLLLLLAPVASWCAAGPDPRTAAAPDLVDEAVPTENAVTRVAVVKDRVEVEFTYTGQPPAATLHVFHIVSPRGQAAIYGTLARTIPLSLPGSYRLAVDLWDPMMHPGMVTLKIGAKLTPGTEAALHKEIDYRFEWGDPLARQVDLALAADTPEAFVLSVASEIDEVSTDWDLGRARAKLQLLVERRPKMAAAYVQLARVALKSSRGSPAGLREAEALLRTALQVEPASSEAKIQLGFVQTKQEHYKEAEASFADAGASDSPNLWLWVYWGDALAKQGKADQAMAKYREAVRRPATERTYAHARRDAYDKLVDALASRRADDELLAVMQKRAEDYPDFGCNVVSYARNLIVVRGEVDRALAALGSWTSGACDKVREQAVRGLVHYVRWSRSSGSDRSDALRQARVYYPVGPHLFYTLALSDVVLPVAEQLVRAGEPVNVRDEQELDALSYALRNGDLGVARRLLRLGADPKAEVGPEKLPAALIPVLARNLDMIRLLQTSGVDYRKLRYQGNTAIDYARSRNDKQLEHLLDPKSGSL